MSMIAVFIGRLFIAVIFLVSGINKLIHVSDTNAMIAAAGLPGWLAIPTGLLAESTTGSLPTLCLSRMSRASNRVALCGMVIEFLSTCSMRASFSFNTVVSFSHLEYILLEYQR